MSDDDRIPREGLPGEDSGADDLLLPRWEPDTEATPAEEQEVDPALRAQQEQIYAAAMEALLEEPFPQKPYALIPAGGERTPEYADYVIHKDVDTEHQCVFVFDSIVDAFAVAEEYKQATGREAEPIEVDIFSLDEDRFWVKFYRANGVVAMLPLQEYKKHLGYSREA